MRLTLTLVTTITAIMVLLLTTNADNAPSARVLPDLNPGEGWQERSPRSQEGVRARAWSDPAAGCNLVLFTLPIRDTVSEVPLRESIRTTLSQTELTLSTDSSPMTFSGKDVTGLAQLGITEKPERSTSLLACYWNDREPTRCRSLCEQSLQAHNKTKP